MLSRLVLWCRVSLTLIVLTSAATAHAADPDSLRLSGATNLDRLIKAKAADIQSKANVNFTTIPNGSGRGLVDLVNGRCDIAMIGGPLSVVADAVNAQTPPCNSGV
jgi:ABC-type phosphate transport system substrate-binding protein